MENEKGAKEKGVIHFKETDRGFVVNRTNAEALAAMFGRETEAWIGKRVKLAAIEVQFGTEKVPGIRVVGSPDIAAPVTFELKLPRKRPQRVTIQCTRAGGQPAPKAAPPPAPTREEGPPEGYENEPPGERIPF